MRVPYVENVNRLFCYRICYRLVSPAKFSRLLLRNLTGPLFHGILDGFYGHVVVPRSHTLANRYARSMTIEHGVQLFVTVSVQKLLFFFKILPMFVKLITRQNCLRKVPKTERVTGSGELPCLIRNDFKWRKT